MISCIPGNNDGQVQRDKVCFDDRIANDDEKQERDEVKTKSQRRCVESSDCGQDTK